MALTDAASDRCPNDIRAEFTGNTLNKMKINTTTPTITSSPLNRRFDMKIRNWMGGYLHKNIKLILN